MIMEVIKQNQSLNMTQNLLTDKDVHLQEDHNKVVIGLWVIGITASVIGLMMQFILFLMVPKGRKFDEIIVCQMTFARTLYTLFEYYFSYHVDYSSFTIKAVVTFFYLYSDIVSLILMFVFTKNLYDKVVVVFPLKNYNLIIVSTIVWIVPIPIAISCPFLLNLNNGSFNTFYITYAYIKFLVCFLNAFIFIKIVYTAFRIVDKQKVKDSLKTALMAFILVIVTSLQVLITDLISYFDEKIQSKLLVSIFCVMYSYQACVLTGIFVVLIRVEMKTPLTQFILKRLKIKLPTAIRT